MPYGQYRLDGLDSKARFVPLRRDDGVRGAVYEDSVEGRSLVARLKAHSPLAHERVFLARKKHIQELWARALCAQLTDYAQHHLARSQPAMSAKHTLTRTQRIVFCLLLVVCVAWAFAALPVLLLAINAAFGFFYLSLGLARLAAVFTPLPAAVSSKRQTKHDGQELLPTYSVLVPIYKEAGMVPHLARTLRRLDYPTDKLEILFLTEADDSATLKALAEQNLPDHMSVLRVPPSHPRTKPKALNFALPLARGTFVTIYDAEDRPEPDQLRKAAAAFAQHELSARQGRSGHKLGCVQAALHITNARKGFLTRHFAFEYMALFDVFLPALAKFNLPIPLGGTSNHFRRAALLQAGGWDPYNVTEDADLGIRLARLGFATQMIASTTFEEAPVRFKPWLKQRARWFKGWWQTWLVHMRHPLALIDDLGVAGFLVLQTILLGVLVSVLIHPVFLVTTLLMMTDVAGPLLGGASGGEQALTLVNLTNFFLGYLAAAVLGGVGAARRGVKGFVGIVLTLPAYWICLSLAGFLALWELVRRPHHWNKTPHVA